MEGRSGGGEGFFGREEGKEVGNKNWWVIRLGCGVKRGFREVGFIGGRGLDC